MAESSGAERKLDQTPTWAVAGICAAIIIISILLEKVLEKISQWFTDKRKRALYEALENVKAELMVMGFISLIFTFSQSYIAKICIPAKLARTMLPCKAEDQSDSSSSSSEEIHRRLLWNEHRALSSMIAPECKKGYVTLISSEGLHQLHILIFFLAVFHVAYSAITMMLGKMKFIQLTAGNGNGRMAVIRGWKVWEHETLSQDYEFSNDPSRFRLTHETSFVKAHSSFWTQMPVFFYVGCFFRQFFRSVTRADYLTLRNGFITTHISPRGRFDFQKYIMRSLEDDFKVVVGVSPLLWASFVGFLLLNVKGWHTMLWASIIPLIIILAVGTKLQAILTRMALEITDRHAVVQGIPLVQGSDRYFWFSRPRLVLHLLHFTLFQNAFQIIYFLWIWYEFGIGSCFHDSLHLAITKISLGGSALFLCSYITLPLYALVTQMGSHMKKSVFDDHTTNALKQWQILVKKKQGDSKEGRSTTRTLGGSSKGDGGSTIIGSTLRSSTTRSLRRFMSTGHLSHNESHEFTDPESDDDSSSHRTPSSSLIVRVDHGSLEAEMTAIPVNEQEKEDEIALVHSDSMK